GGGGGGGADGREGVGGLLEDAVAQPPPGLLVDRRPRREVVGQEPPCAAGLDHVPQRVEQLPKRMLTLRGVLRHETKVGKQKRPFRVRDVATVGLPWSVHPAKNMAPQTPRP